MKRNTRPALLERLIPCAAALTLAALAALSFAAGAGDKGLDFAGIDRSVAPGDDFFRYANGSWLAKTEIPPDRSAWGTGAALAELTLKRTDELIRAADASAAPATEARKIGDYYASYLDAARIEQLGLTPLMPLLKEIDAINDRAALARALGSTLRADVDVLNNTNLYTENLFGLWVAQDLSEPTRYSPFLLQGGLGMPDRDYYLNSSQKMADIRTQYQAHIAAVLSLARLAGAQEKAKAIFELERRIAEVHVSRAESEEVLKGNNHWSAAEFPQRAPGLDWAAFFAAAGLAQQREFVVWQPGAVSGISTLTASAPLETWKDYLRFHLIDSLSGYLPKAFVAEQFAFHQHVLSGTPEQESRWKRAVEETNDALGEAVGKLYVAKYFPPEEKARAEAMVRNLVAAFATRIDRLDWMAPGTRAKAKAKLSALRVGVGYPDHWRDYSGLEVVRGDAFGNARRAQLFDYHHSLKRLGGPVDRDEWVMNPQLVNAVNLPAMNAINFPAAILQPPNFDPQRDPVMDYGAIGAVIGHEISHSFDDQGALFDAGGKLQNWWTKEDFAHFEDAGKRLVEQFNAYHPFPDISVNGRQTLSENIADVAGLADSFDAWRLSLHGGAAPTLAGFSGEQLFFLSFAQTWRRKTREPALRRQVVTDGHSPAEYRADTVRNLDAWYDAFKAVPGQKLYLAPGDRVRVW
ncbi:MAG TPA: M13 family metallopeptidase [Steroidobacteraceae bacterium]|jgi:predicted metalloendopeptidase|nr:M13 family metallopeptidase [Steroidobacteraceae bacterium]